MTKIDISRDTTQVTLLKKIQLALRRKLASSEGARKLFDETWKFIVRIEAVGIKIDTEK